MIVQHNIMAINAHRQLGINNKNLAANLEKLSSGYRINRAADDAAGLAISEKMRAQITGINRAVLNAQDGASLIQTAEGALAEVHSMLNRMVELATQSANGTIMSDDRQKIESELNALKGEIDRISKATNFNGIDLLNGALSTAGANNVVLDGIATTTVPATTSVSTFTAGSIGAGEVVAGTTVSMGMALSNGTAINITLTAKDASTFVAADGTEYTLGTAGAASATEIGDMLVAELAKTALSDSYTVANAAGALTFTAKVAGTAAPQITAANASSTAASGLAGGVALAATTVGVDAYETADVTKMTVFDGSNESNATFTVNGKRFILTTAAEATNIKDSSTTAIIVAADPAAAADAPNIAAIINRETGLQVTNTGATLNFLTGNNAGTGLTMQVGDTAKDFNKITVSIDDMSSQGLGIANISMATQTLASAALDSVKAAIEKVSVNRGNLGALQNRLDHTINNLNVTSENMTAAESRIRDVDMAKEMMSFTKNNVLSQAAQAMLAQANQMPQQVLQLLR